MTLRRKHSPGLPNYLPCPTCYGTGYVSGEVHSAHCECGGRGGNCPGGRVETDNCPNCLCFDGDVICTVCSYLGILPRVENCGPDYIVPVLATVMDGEEAVCAHHFNFCEKGHAFMRTDDGPICECDPSHPSHDEERSERAWDRQVEDFYGASTPQTVTEQYHAAAELKQKVG